MTKKVSNGFIRQAVYSKYNGHCAYCGCEIDELEPFFNDFDAFREAFINKLGI